MRDNIAPPLFQVVQPGFDVRTCPDWAYLFNSNWPNLAIAWEQTVSITVPTTYNHNLGFIPLPVVTNHTSAGRTYGRQMAGVGVTSTQVTLAPNVGDTLTIRLYNVDVAKEQAYPLPQGANAKLPYNSNFGVKATKQDRLITSSNLNDFIIHSRAQSPAILNVATEKGKYFTNVNPGSHYMGPWIVVPIKTSYIPWVYLMLQSGTSPLTYSTVTVNGLEIINNQLVFPLISNTGGSIVILRDPLFYPNTVRVVF